jgi:hypothetical protein
MSNSLTPTTVELSEGLLRTTFQFDPIAAIPPTLQLPTVIPRELLTHIQSEATKTERQAARIASWQQPSSEPTTPSEEDLLSLTVDEELARESVQEARAHFTAKAQHYESLRLRLEKARKKFNISIESRRETRRREMMAARRAAMTTTAD